MFQSNSDKAELRLFQAITQNNIQEVKTILNSEEFANSEKIDAPLDGARRPNKENKSVFSLNNVSVERNIILSFFNSPSVSINLANQAGFSQVEPVLSPDDLSLGRHLTITISNSPSVPINLANQAGLSQVEPVAPIGDSAFSNNGKPIFQENLSPMQLAAALGYLPIVKALREKGARIDVPSADTLYMPIHFAAENGHLEVVQSLVDELGADPNVINQDGLSALHLAARKGHLLVVEFLCEQERVDINIKNRLGTTPLHLASESGHQAIVEFLCQQNGIDPSVLDTFDTALHRAASKGHKAIVEFLCQQERVDINAKDRLGNNALHLASKSGHPAIVEFLCQQERVDINAKDRLGNNALHLASKSGHLNLVKWICTIGKIDPNIVNHDGENALSCAITTNRREIVNALLETGVNVSDTLALFAVKKFRTGVLTSQEFNFYHQYLSEINMLLAYFSNPSLSKNLSVNQIPEYLEKYKNLSLRNEHRISLLDLMLQNIIDKPVEEIGVSQEAKDQILMFFAGQVINDFHINKTKQETEQAKDLEDFLVIIERLASAIENHESLPKYFVKLAEKYRSLMDETADNYTALIIDAYEKAIEFSKDVDFLAETHLRLAFDYLQLNNDVPFVQNDIRDEKAKYHANLAGQSQAAVALRKKLYFGLGNHDDKDDPLELNPIKAQNDLDKNEELKQERNSSATQLLYSYKKQSSEGDLKNGPEDDQSNQNDNNTPSSRR